MNLQERITARAVVEDFAAHRGISVADIGVAPTVIVVWVSERAASLASALGAEASSNWPYAGRNPLYSARGSNAAVCVLQAPVGAAGTVMMLEELAACGATRVMGLGGAGGLQPGVPNGSLVLATGCLAEEGTSPHYPIEVPAAPDAALATAFANAARNAGVALHSGPVWTTDAPYRETVHKIQRYQADGVLAVDMETSAMYAAARYRGVAACNLLVVTDEVWRDWNPAFFSSAVAAAWSAGEGLLMGVLASIGSGA